MNIDSRSRGRVNFSAYLFLFPALVAFALFKYYPMILGFISSFFNFDVVNPPGKFIGFDNYIRAFNDPVFFQSIWNTFEFVIVTLVLNFWVPIFLAILINEVRSGKTLLRTLYFLPAIAPGVAVTVLWKYIWQPDYGFANYMLGLLNIQPQMWLNDPAMVKWCMKFPGLVAGGGMNMIIYLAALQDIPEEHYEAALMEGAGFINKIRYIVLPQIRPIVGIMLILTLIGAFNYFDEPYIMTGGGPMDSTTTMVLYGFKAAYRSGEYGYGLSITSIVFVIVFIITAIQLNISSKQEGK